MTVVPNLLDQDRKAFPFLRGEFLSDISITIVMASDGATDVMQSLCRPCTNEQHEPSCRTSEERYWQFLAFTRFMTPWMELARKLSKPVVVRRHAPLAAPFAVVDATTNYLHVLFNPLEQCHFL